jgi:MFS family permease
MLSSYDQGVFGGIVGNEDFNKTFGYPNSGLEGIIVAIYDLGAFTGCIVTFVIGEKLGRRRAMWLAMVFIIVSAQMLFKCVSISGSY